MPTVNYRPADEIGVAFGGSSTAQDVNYLRQSAHERIRDLVREYQTQKQQVETDGRLSGAAVLDDVAALRERITAAVNDAETSGKEAIGRLRAGMSKVTQGPQDTQAQVLRELQISQGYTRIRLMLDAGEDVLQVAQDAGQQGDRAAIMALRVYASALLSGQSPSLVDAVQRALDAGETPFLSTAQLVARDLAFELEVGSRNLTGAAAMARYIVSGTNFSAYIQAWQQSGSLPIAGTIPGAPTSPASRGGYQPLFPERGR